MRKCSEIGQNKHVGDFRYIYIYIYIYRDALFNTQGAEYYSAPGPIHPRLARPAQPSSAQPSCPPRRKIVYMRHNKLLPPVVHYSSQIVRQFSKHRRKEKEKTWLT
jgi:hypothetical protein